MIGPGQQKKKKQNKKGEAGDNFHFCLDLMKRIWPSSLLGVAPPQTAFFSASVFCGCFY